MKKKIEENIGLLIILVLFVLYTISKIVTYPVYIDEALTYVDYTSRGFWISFSRYYHPNNHVFLSLLICLFQKLPIDLLIAMRLPNFIIGFLCITILYKYLKFKYSIWTTFIISLVFTFSYTFIFYSIFARGYLILITCTLISFILLDKIAEKQKIKYLVMYGLTTAVGFFTIPIYLYITITLSVIIGIRFWGDLKKIKSIIITYLLTSFLVLLLYTPILIINGLNAITNNKYNSRKEVNIIYNLIKDFWFGFYDKIWGFQSGILILLLISIGLYFTWKREKKGVEFLVTIFLPYIILFIHRTIPGFRTWTYEIIPMIIFLAFITEIVITRIQEKHRLLFTIILSCLIFSFQTYIFQKSHPNSGHQNDVEANEISNYLLKFDTNTCVNFVDGKSEYFALIYQFERNRLGKKNKIVFNKDIFNQPKNSIIVSNKQFTSNKIVLIKKFKTKFVYKLM